VVQARTKRSKASKLTVDALVHITALPGVTVAVEDHLGGAPGSALWEPTQAGQTLTPRDGMEKGGVSTHQMDTPSHLTVLDYFLGLPKRV
jgi:hypothetical protein